MQQTLVVVDMIGEDVIVEGGRASACGSCAGKSSCSTLGSWKQRNIRLRIANTISARVGDQVVVEVPDGWMIRVAFKLYGLPMLGFIGGGFLGLFMAELLSISSEVSSALGAVTGAAVVYLLLWRSPEQVDAKMVRIID